MKSKIFFILVSFIFLLNFVSSAHYITGYVVDAKDGESANSKTIILWNPLVGIEDNLTDIVGINGNSGVSNVYMIDCEMLNMPCVSGDILSLKIINNGDEYSSDIVNVTVGNEVYDVVENISLNSIPVFQSILVDDSFNLTLNEIDLISNSTQKIFCNATIYDYEGQDLTNIYGVFYTPTYSTFFDSDDNNYHYTNNSCFVNNSYGENTSFVSCSFEVFYYAFSENWNCEINVSDLLSTRKGIDDAFINPLLSIGVIDMVNFTDVLPNRVSDEIEIQVTNFGNVFVDLSLYGYAREIGDGFAMNCSEDNKTIPIYYKKYNLSSSIFGDLDINQFEQNYINLTSSPEINTFNLSLRTDDLENNAIKSTYWRIFVPSGIFGNCEGNIVFGAVSVE